ncbi:hypothetical protein [Paenibacillus flagellatus]|uniref:hypothetical protein n=1 Tax=Paenibacillus flagellatus TaxID=2211139 RepID=UPI001FE42728|nr:hypothetical protein [Paenibacillus flagellatus]
MSKCYNHCPAQTVYDPPRVVYRDFYHPQLVQVIHPVEIVNRHHCVPVYQHLVTCTVKDEYCDNQAYISVRGRAAVSRARSRGRR